MTNIKKTLQNHYDKDTLNEMAYHVFEKSFYRLNNHELKVFREWLRRHDDLIYDK